MTISISVAESVFGRLNKALLAISDAESLDQALLQIVETARELVQARYGALGVPDDDGGLARFVHSGMDPAVVDAMPGLPAGKGLLRAIMLEQRTIRIPAIGDDPRSVGFPQGHPPMDSFLGVPIMDGEVVLGNLYLTEKIGAAEFDEDEQRLVEILAEHAALALRRAQMVEELRVRNDLISKRNRQLDALNQAAMLVARDLAMERALQHIIDAARELVNARYGALGVPNREGYLTAFITSGVAKADVDDMGPLPKGHGLLGALIRDRKPIRLAAMGQDPRFQGFPGPHPQMSSFLGVPILAGDEVLGNLYLTDRLDGLPFTEEDQEFVERLADHAALAIQNAHLYEQVERLAVLEERTRIGMDLHDGVIQSIYGVALTLESARMTLPDPAHESSQLVEMAMHGLEDAIRDIRSFILDLRPRRFRGDLSTGLSQLVREFQANALVPVELHVPDDLASLPPGMARAAFLTTQEALANVARHAKATAATLTVELVDGFFHLVLVDNGVGFDVRDHSRRIGHGLANMQARAEALGGRFELHSAHGSGTTIRVLLPLSDAGRTGYITGSGEGSY